MKVSNNKRSWVCHVLSMTLVLAPCLGHADGPEVGADPYNQTYTDFENSYKQKDIATGQPAPELDKNFLQANGGCFVGLTAQEKVCLKNLDALVAGQDLSSTTLSALSTSINTQLNTCGDAAIKSRADTGTAQATRAKVLNAFLASISAARLADVQSDSAQGFSTYDKNQAIQAQFMALQAAIAKLKAEVGTLEGNMGPVPLLNAETYIEQLGDGGIAGPYADDLKNVKALELDLKTNIANTPNLSAGDQAKMMSQEAALAENVDDTQSNFKNANAMEYNGKLDGAQTQAVKWGANPQQAKDAIDGVAGHLAVADGCAVGHLGKDSQGNDILVANSVIDPDLVTTALSRVLGKKNDGAQTIGSENADTMASADKVLRRIDGDTSAQPTPTVVAPIPPAAGPPAPAVTVVPPPAAPSPAAGKPTVAPAAAPETPADPSPAALNGDTTDSLGRKGSPTVLTGTQKYNRNPNAGPYVSKDPNFFTLVQEAAPLIVGVPTLLGNMMSPVTVPTITAPSNTVNTGLGLATTTTTIAPTTTSTTSTVPSIAKSNTATIRNPATAAVTTTVAQPKKPTIRAATENKVVQPTPDNSK
jgi:hypothetical protein